MGVTLDKKLGANLQNISLKKKSERLSKMMRILNYKRAPPSVRLHVLKSFLLGLTN